MLAKGPNNEIIVRDDSTNQLVVFDGHFQYSHVIGGAGSGNGKFQCITGIAIDKKGCLYVADCHLNCIQILTLKGEYISQFASKGTTEGQLNYPDGLLLSKSELLFVCDYNNHRIQVFQNQQFSYCFGHYGTDPGAFDGPSDLTLNDSEDQLFITDYNNHRVQIFTIKGCILKVLNNFPKLKYSVGIHCTSDGYLLISSRGASCVLILKEDGMHVSTIDRTLQGNERFSNPCGVVMMNGGQIIITDQLRNRLVVF